MTLPWQGTTPEISAESDSRYETPGGAQNKVDSAYEILLNMLKIAVTGMSNGSEAAIARYSDPYDITYEWLKERLDAMDARGLLLEPEKETKTLYVNYTTGNDTTGTGTSIKPFKTITKAINSCNKSLLAKIVIRVFPGDYRAEGKIDIRYFKGAELVLTAFNGTNEVSTVNDSYIIDSLDIYGSWITVQGIKSIPSTTDYAYGFFASGGFVSYIGCSMQKDGNENSGFGCTGNSYIWINKCKVKNSLNVISANFGARVFVSEWNAESTGNTYVFKMDNGAIVYRGDNTLPEYTDLFSLLGPSGQILDQFGISESIVTTNHKLVTVDLAQTGNLVIPISFQKAPSWINANAGMTGTKVTCNGVYSKTNPSDTQSSIYTNVNGDAGAAFSLINIDLGTSNVNYKIISVTSSAITLQRTAVNSPTGTIYVSILCGM